MINRIVLGAFLAMAWALPSHAVTQYVCSFKQSAANGSWVPETVAIAWDEENKRVEVYDPIIHFFFDRPIAGEVAISNAKRVTFKWVLKGIDTPRNQHITGFNYRMTVLKNNSASLLATPLGYADNFKGRGKCSVKRG